MTTIRWLYIGWGVMFIMNIIVALVDFLNGGHAIWPVNALVVLSMIIMRLT